MKNINHSHTHTQRRRKSLGKPALLVTSSKLSFLSGQSAEFQGQANQDIRGIHPYIKQQYFFNSGRKGHLPAFCFSEAHHGPSTCARQSPQSTFFPKGTTQQVSQADILGEKFTRSFLQSLLILFSTPQRSSFRPFIMLFSHQQPEFAQGFAPWGGKLPLFTPVRIHWQQGRLACLLTDKILIGSC